MSDIRPFTQKLYNICISPKRVKNPPGWAGRGLPVRLFLLRRVEYRRGRVYLGLHVNLSQHEKTAMPFDLKHAARRIRKGIRNLPHLAMGYNIYVDRDKLDLLRHALTRVRPGARSFADLGAVWKVNAGYTLYILRNFSMEKAFLVDTHIPREVRRKLAPFGTLTALEANFGADEVLAKIGHVDVVLLFDVLLHQVRPDWDEVLLKYSAITDCFVIFNQQLAGAEATVKLTDLSLAEYKAIVPTPRQDLYEFIFSHRDDVNPDHNRPWIDIPDIFQWGITDRDLRSVMNNLGFREVYYRTYGQFSRSGVFENHAFIFVKGPPGPGGK
jgi:hypothetical protein